MIAIDTLGMTPEELREAMTDGATLGEVAAANGVSKQDLSTALTEAANEKIAAAEDSGKITAEQATRLREAVAERTPGLVDRLWDVSSAKRGKNRSSGDDTNA